MKLIKLSLSRTHMRLYKFNIFFSLSLFFYLSINLCFKGTCFGHTIVESWIGELGLYIWSNEEKI